VKDYRCNGFFFRNTVGRFLVWREALALMRLHGVPGVPRLRCRVRGPALVMDAVSGRPVEGLERQAPLPRSFFEDLYTLVEAVHARGVAHCDLKRAPNILLGDDGAPHIVDWSSSISKAEFRPFPLSLVYRRFVLDDLNALIKLRLKHRPSDIPTGELELYNRRGPLERLARRLRDRARDVLKRLA
jgi:serine/threonine protein kinase